MRHLAARLFTHALVVIVIASAVARAQEIQVETRNPPAPSRAAGAEVFTSIEGGFSIALPPRIHGYSTVTNDTPKGKETVGDTLTWVLDGTQYDVMSIEMPGAPTTAADIKAVIARGADSTIANLTGKGGKLLGNTEISLAGHAGRELKFEVGPREVVYRIYLVGRKAYQLTAVYEPTGGKRENVVRVLDSFRLLSASEVEEARRKRIAAATPSPLPQEPVAKKLKSDAQDDGLAGRVKSVLIERENLSGTSVVGRRKPSQMEHYDERGNMTRRELYDYKGNLFEITVYGYLDGERASAYKIVEHEYSPPVGVIAGPPAPAKKRDMRYHYKYKYAYDDAGRLAEEVYVNNAGETWMRYVYKFSGNQKENLVYSANGSLNQKYVETLDAKGNKVEESFYDVKTDKVRTKYSYTYDAFDAQGNWTKRTASKWVEQDGKPSLVPDHVTYRTITYY
ncbi:MAG TPA: hypothetical protein VFX96_02690 [Pyrinomonadaceae bacterium]|nr:hypothetical protein [Pyrinomonadaceae bacterium]